MNRTTEDNNLRSFHATQRRRSDIAFWVIVLGALTLVLAAIHFGTALD